MSRLLILVGVLFLMGACENAPSQKEVYSILIDGTDAQITKPNVDEIMNYMDLRNMDKELVIRISELSEVDYMPVVQLHFKPEKGLLSNQLDEKRKERQFKKALEDVIRGNDSIAPSEYSNIFDPLCNELKYLSALEGYQKIELLVYSDLKENNSQWMSFYHKGTRRQLLQKSKRLHETFLKRIPELSTKNVGLQIIHVPRGQKENVEFSAIRELYKSVFSQSHIPISFSGNLVKTPPSR